MLFFKCEKMALVGCDTNYCNGGLIFKERKKKRMDNSFDAFLKCEKMALVGCDTNYYYGA